MRTQSAGVLALAAAAGVLMAAGPVTAQTVYEGFNPTFPDYRGGVGLTGAWSQGPLPATQSSFTASESSLSYGTLQINGGSVSGIVQFSDINGAVRTLAQSIGADTTTAYVSLLLQPQGTLDEGVFNGFFGLTLNGDLNHLFIGKPGGPREYVIETQGGTGQVSSGVPTVVGETALLVVKAQFLPGQDVFTLYVNPVPGNPEPATGAMKSDLKIGTVSQIQIFSTGAFTVDEIRIGATYGDVVPVQQ